jgi:hypothetical protein
MCSAEAPRRSSRASSWPIGSAPWRVPPTGTACGTGASWGERAG